MKTRFISIPTLAAIAGFVAFGCSSNTTASNSNGGASSGQKEYKIALIAKSSTNPVFQASLTGAKAAAADLGKKLGIKIHIDWLTPPTEDGQVQAQKIEQAVNSGDDAVIISCSDATKVTAAINDAMAKGVLVMTFDSDAPDSKRFAYYGADDIECGHEIMDELGAQMGGKGNYAILAGNQNAPNLQRRAKAVVAEQQAKFPNMKLVGTFYHQETPDDAARKVLDTMNAHPEIQGWAMVGGWPLFTRSLLGLDPSKVKIVSVDALPQELPYVERGIAPVLLAQPVFDWGYKSVTIVIDKLVLHQNVPVFNKMPLIRVTKANLGTWAQQLKTWGFDVPQKYLAMASK